MAETDRYVAFGSEYRAFVNLPDIEMPAFGNRNRQRFIFGNTDMQIFDLEADRPADT